MEVRWTIPQPNTTRPIRGHSNRLKVDPTMLPSAKSQIRICTVKAAAVACRIKRKSESQRKRGTRDLSKWSNSMRVTLWWLMRMVEWHSQESAWYPSDLPLFTGTGLGNSAINPLKCRTWRHHSTECTFLSQQKTVLKARKMVLAPWMMKWRMQLAQRRVKATLRVATTIWSKNGICWFRIKCLKLYRRGTLIQRGLLMTRSLTTNLKSCIRRTLISSSTGPTLRWSL